MSEAYLSEAYLNFSISVTCGGNVLARGSGETLDKALKDFYRAAGQTAEFHLSQHDQLKAAIKR